MSNAFYNLRRQFKHKLDEYINNKTSVIIGGSCVDYTTYKSEVSKISGALEAYDIFVEALRDLTKEDIDDEDDD